MSDIWSTLQAHETMQIVRDSDGKIKYIIITNSLDLSITLYVKA